MAQESAVKLIPDTFSEKYEWLNNLGVLLQSRFKRHNNLDDIGQAISLHQRAIDLIPHDHASKARLLADLAHSLQKRFYCTADISDVEKGIDVQQQAIQLTPSDHLERVTRLEVLGVLFRSLFEHCKKSQDLDKALSIQEEVVNLTPDDQLQKSAVLTNLGGSFLRRFEHLGTLNDLEQAIACQQHAFKLISDDHPDRETLLTNLAISLQTRFFHLGDPNDLEQAVDAGQRAVNITPDDHPDKPGVLSNLGSLLHTQFETLRRLEDLGHSIINLQQAANLTPDDHPSKPLLLNNLGISLRTQFDQSGNIDDLEQALKIQQQALHLIPASHPDKPLTFNNIGISFQSRFDRLQKSDDLDKALESLQKAVELAPEGHIEKARFLINLGKAFVRRFHLHQDQGDIHKIISAFRTASLNISSPPSLRFQAAKYWATVAAPRGLPSSAIEAYQTLLEILPQYIWLGQKVTYRYKELSDIGDVINAAVAMAISIGNLKLAVEWLEEGRSIVWGQILQLRTPVDELSSHHPSLASELQQVSQALEHAGIPSKQQPTDLEEEGRKHRDLAMRYEKIINQIRRLDGFEDFLLPKKLEKLLPLVPSQGPIILINVHKSRCDALILHSEFDDADPVVHVELPDFTHEQAEELYQEMKKILQHNSVRSNRKLTLDIPKIKKDHDSLQSILASLWFWIVKPVLIKLQTTVCLKNSISHITWCATGVVAFLPLHAAGVYEPLLSLDGANILHVISSYIPTLTALLTHLTRPCDLRADVKQMLIVAQPNTPGQRTLPGTVDEAEMIMKKIPGEVHCLTHDEATISEVLGLLEQYRWIHFACHGIQDTSNPLNSAFALYDGKLALDMLMPKYLPHAELAFLSACQTATGDEKLPEEAVHLAAGMINAGFPRVIATMWSISDQEAPLIADVFYSTLLQEKRVGFKLNSAYALHEAVKKLRETVGIQNFLSWVPFVHFGL
ncbi:hypothetical protein M422DRAFT_173475 [Sphaerobolus stellatus SS14]|uniref:CHAT domain-containing protein n=1 Tax=Sphaerobolus stellatus (strain SS14) TaxID=990650 RepID=A0A0C9VRC2_SPHS4|nr:hypothetical protein M422DRAFT_173475 [Sphaerobolus stellatus SS14]